MKRALDLSPDRRDALITAVQQTYSERFDEPLSDFRAGEVVDMMTALIGPPVYNQAVQHVRAHLQARLDDLDGEVWMPETPPDES